MSKNNRSLKIFSYLPNPRVWKSLITASILNVEIEVVGAKANQIENWLWDFNARELTEEDKEKYSDRIVLGKTGFSKKLYKTKEFIKAHPFGTIPAAFSPDGNIGIFESNSIMRLVARVKNGHSLYGNNPYEQSRIDSFLDVSLIFAKSKQLYFLSILSGEYSESLRRDTETAYVNFMTGIENCLKSHKKKYILGDKLTLADICFFCEYALLYRDKIKPKGFKGSTWKPIMNETNNYTYKKSVELFQSLRKKTYFFNVSNNYLYEIESKIV